MATSTASGSRKNQLCGCFFLFLSLTDDTNAIRNSCEPKVLRGVTHNYKF